MVFLKVRRDSRVIGPGGVSGRGFRADSLWALLLRRVSGLQALDGVVVGCLWEVGCGMGYWSLAHSVAPVVSIPFSGHFIDLSK